MPRWHLQTSTLGSIHLSHPTARGSPTPRPRRSPLSVDTLTAFPEGDSLQQFSIPTACGSWHDGAGHFLTLYIRKGYWSLMDPLRDIPHPPPDMQSNMHTALCESFRARNLPNPTLPQYKQVPRISVQQDAPRPAWSCGTITMCTTLHLLLGDRLPHELPGQYITRDNMLTLHKALLEWLILGTPPAMWQIACIHQDIHRPIQAHTCPYSLLSIAAAASLPKGQPWRPIRSTFVGPPPTLTPTPSATGDGTLTPQQTVLSPLPSVGRIPCLETVHRTLDPHHGPFTRDPNPALHEVELPASTRAGHLSTEYRKPERDSETAAMPTPKLINAPKWGTFTGLLIPRGAVRTRLGRAKKLATARLRINKANNQSMLVNHSPTLRPP